MSAPVAVVVRELEKRFGRFVAVNKVSFEVGRGEIFGFLGPNGAGKSTTIRMLCGLLRPSGGTAEVAGVDVGRDPEGVKRRIGYMSQRFSLYGDLTVRQNLELYAALYGVTGERLARRMSWAFELTRLEPRATSKVAELPGGFRQRLALACALLHEPEVIFLDEPTGGVDPVMRRTFFEVIQELSDKGVTVFVTTHFLDEAEYCHRVAFIAAGRLIALGTPLELKARLATRALFEIRTGDLPGALQRLRGLEVLDEAAAFGAWIHASGKPGVDAAAVRAELERSVPGARISPIEPTLEDVFIRLAAEAR